MKPSSAKQKGRSHQQWIAKQLLKIAKVIAPDVDINEDDVVSTPMGVSGADIQLSTAARRVFNFDIEAKNVQRLNVWDAIKQCKANSKKGTPLLVIKKNHHEVWVALKWDDFAKIAWGVDPEIKDDEF